MKRINRWWIALALAPAFAAFLAFPGVSSAATKGKHVKCQVSKDGKMETEMVATSKECTAMGGKVLTSKTKKSTAHKTTTQPATPKTTQ